MDTKTLHQSSWGRILLMLRADLVTHKTTLLVFFAAFIGLAFCIPRLPILAGVSYADWENRWRYTYEADIINTIMTIASSILYFIYVNRRIVHSTPTLFSTLPASLGEKVLSVLLYGLIIHILGVISTLVSQGLELITVADMPVSFKTVWSSFFGTILEIQDASVTGMLLAIGMSLSSVAITFWGSISMRNIFLGLVLSWLIQMGISVMAVSVFANIFLERISEENLDTFIILGLFFSWAIASIFIYLIYKKLRSIAS